MSPVDVKTLQTSPMIVGDSGQLIWRPDADQLANDFRPQVLDGKTYLTYISLYEINPILGFGWGYVPFLDSSYEEMYRVTPGGRGSDLNFKPPGGGSYDSYIDLHEAQPTDIGTLLVTAVNATQLDLTSVGEPKDGWVTDGQFYEIDVKTNKILFRWSAAKTCGKYPWSFATNLYMGWARTVASPGAMRI